MTTPHRVAIIGSGFGGLFSAQSLRKADVLRLGEGMDNWVSVDVFSCSIAGQLWRERALPDAELLRWARSRDRWWRRAAAVAGSGRD